MKNRDNDVITPKPKPITEREPSKQTEHKVFIPPIKSKRKGKINIGQGFIKNFFKE